MNYVIVVCLLVHVCTLNLHPYYLLLCSWLEVHLQICMHSINVIKGMGLSAK